MADTHPKKITLTPDPTKIIYVTSDELRHFESGATRTASSLRYDLIPPTALRALAERYGLGAAIHGESNWLKGIPFSAILYHMQEHIERFKQGQVKRRVEGPNCTAREDGDIENMAAVAWGAFAIIHYLSTGREALDDRPYRESKSEC